jgi:membrane protease YdiL (CAAX protease family)
MNQPLSTSERSTSGLHVVVICLAGFIIAEFVAAALQAVSAALHGGVNLVELTRSPQQPPWLVAAGLIGLWIGFGATAWWGLSHELAPRWPTMWRVRWYDLGALVVGFALQLLVGVLYAPFHVKGLNGPATKLLGPPGGHAIWWTGLLTVIGAPLFEELFFRATLFGGLEAPTVRRFGPRGWIVAATLSAVLFAAAHGEALQAPGLFVAGLVLAVIYHRTRRIAPSFMAHVGFNLLAVVTYVRGPH